MGCCICACILGPLIILVLLVLAYLCLKQIYSFLFDIPELPKIDESYYWGSGEATQDESDLITPFRINVNEQDLQDFKTRLSNTRPFTPPLQGVQHQYGINTKLLSEIKHFWETSYDWRERETFLNQFPQYKTKIQGLDIHFLHVKPSPKHANDLKVVPILLLHGWPGSVREFYEVIPRLVEPTTGRNFVFEVIAPSLPGYGFSEAASRPGLNTLQMAVVFKNLMVRLKFEKWYVQGGDWGSLIGTNMAMMYPEEVLGFHFNTGMAATPLATLKMWLGAIWPGLLVSREHQSKLYPLGSFFKKLLDEMGYMHLQSTRPDTVGLALNDSPIGLAAYIIEKFIAWTNMNHKNLENGGLLDKFTYTKLLDNVMIYWFSKSITTSCRLYAESFSKTFSIFTTAKFPVRVPCALAQFEHELTYSNRALLKDKYTNLLQVNEFKTGGHFAALEEPALFAADVWDAIEVFENYHKTHA